MAKTQHYYELEPEVAGELGDETTMDQSSFPPVVKKLHYVFQGWLKDCFVESFPCYLVTEPVKSELERIHATGCTFDTVLVTTSPEFKELHPSLALPHFVWLKVGGKAGKDDFGMSAQHRIVVSERVLHILQHHSLKHCDIGQWRAGKESLQQ